MYKMKIVEVIVKVIIIIILLKFVAKWPYDKIIYVIISLIAIIYIIWPLLVKLAKVLGSLFKKLL